MAITRDMAIGEVVQKHPETVEVFLRHGLFCLGCAAAHFEDIEQGAMAHGIELEPLITDLNAALAEEAGQN